MVNNLQIIIPLLKFESDDDFYHLQIMRRRKENKEQSSNNRTIKTYYISSIEYLETRFDEIKQICDVTNSRAYINLNVRSYEKCAFQMLRKVTDIILNKDFQHAKRAFESVCGSYSAGRDKRWIIDLDDVTFVHPAMIDFINTYCEPFGTDKFVATIPTKNGVHLITKPFNLQKFSEMYKGIEIHKDNPSLIYVP